MKRICCLLVVICGLACSEQSDKNIQYVALTFDDGPSHFETPILLNLLHQKKVPATFFLLGENLEKNTSVARDIVAAGHQIGNHSYSHQAMDSLTLQQFVQELNKTDSLIAGIGYSKKPWFRAPFNRYSEAMLEHLNHIKRKVSSNSIHGKDWTVPSVREIYNAIYPKVRNGTVIVLHDAAPLKESLKERINSVEAARMLIDSLQAKNYVFVTLEELEEKVHQTPN